MNCECFCKEVFSLVLLALLNRKLTYDECDFTNNHEKDKYERHVAVLDFQRRIQGLEQEFVQATLAKVANGATPGKGEREERSRISTE